MAGRRTVGPATALTARDIVREELTSFAERELGELRGSSPSGVDDDSEGSRPKAPLSEEQTAAISRADALLDAAIEPGDWTRDDQENLLDLLPMLPEEEAYELHLTLSRAVNRGDIRPSALPM